MFNESSMFSVSDVQCSAWVILGIVIRLTTWKFSTLTLNQHRDVANVKLFTIVGRVEAAKSVTIVLPTTFAVVIGFADVGNLNPLGASWSWNPVVNGGAGTQRCLFFSLLGATSCLNTMGLILPGAPLV